MAYHNGHKKLSESKEKSLHADMFHVHKGQKIGHVWWNQKLYARM